MPTTTFIDVAIGERQLEGQARVLELMARGAPLHESMNALLELRELLHPGMRTSIIVLDEDGVHMRHLVARGLPQSYIRAVDGMPIGPRVGACGTAMYRRESVFCADLTTDPLWEDFRPLVLELGLRSCWSQPIFDADGKVLGSFACYFPDFRRPTAADERMTRATVEIASIAISRSREEKRLRESEAALNAAQRVARVGSYELQVHKNRGTWSRELFRLMGRDPALGVPTVREFAEQYLHPEDAPRLAEAHARSLRTGEPYSMELRLKPTAGQQRTLLLNAQPMLDDNGEVARFIGTLLDVTDRKALAAQARDSALRLNLAVTAAQVEIFEWDLPLRRVYFSPAFKRHLGFAEGEIDDSFETWRERTHPDDLDVVARGVRTLLEQPTGGFQVEYRLRHRDGSWRWVYAQAAVVRNEKGRPTRVLGSLIDITDRKAQQEALREHQEELRRLSRELLEAEVNERCRLAGELHDRVGQNLSSLVLNLGVLRRTLPLDDQAMERLRDSEQLLEQTINEVRTVMAELRPTELDDFGLLQAVRYAAESAGDRAGFKVFVEGTDPEPKLHIGVETAMYRIAREALNNVAKHAQARNVWVTLIQDAESVTLQVRDDGRGMTDEDGQRGGRGLRGMRERAHSLGASLDIESSPGGGTCLSVRVPRT